MKLRSLVRPLSFLTCISAAAIAFAACTADGGDLPLVEEQSPATPPPTSQLPPAQEAGPEEDASKPDAAKDASKDAKTEASVDAGPPAPETGDPCKVADEVFSRQCGACGIQKALCVSPDGGAGTVSIYGPCEGELAGGCIPGSVVDEACGNCGTRKKTCSKYCAFSLGACTGEPPLSCLATSNDYTTAGCTTAGTYRTRECSDTCKWSSYSATCGPIDFKLTASATVGETKSAIFPLRAAMVEKRLTGTCPSGTLSTTTDHPNAYVEIVNPSSQTLTVSAWNTVSKEGGVIIDTVMGWYNSADRPTDEAGRKACAKGMIDACPTGLPCGDTKWAGITGANAMVIPPNSSVTLYFGSYYALSSSSTTVGDVKVVVRTDTAL